MFSVLSLVNVVLTSYLPHYEAHTRLCAEHDERGSGASRSGPTLTVTKLNCRTKKHTHRQK
jgi:hypothetical protein